MFFLHLETKLVFRNSACFYRLFLLLVAKVIFPISWSIVMIKVMHKIPKGRCRFFLWNTKIAFGTLCPKISIWAMSKVENLSKVAWIWSHHLHLQWKFKLWAGKFAWGVKAKHFWMLSTNMWIQKICWHHPAMFCRITSSKLLWQ